MELSGKIKLLRKTEGLTQKKISELLNIDVTSIQNYENNRRKPNTDFMETLCRQFPKYTLWLMTNDEKSSTIQINPIANGGANIAGNNYAPLHIDNRKTENKTTNIIKTHPTQEKAFIDGNLKSNLRNLYDKIYKVRVKGKKNTNPKKEHKWMWKRLNDYMGVASYDCIKQSDYQKADDFMNDWLFSWVKPSNKVTDLWNRAHQAREIDEKKYFQLLNEKYDTYSLKDLTQHEIVETIETMINESTSADFES